MALCCIVLLRIQGHATVKNNFSMNLVQIRIKMEYGRITYKTAKIRIGYG